MRILVATRTIFKVAIGDRKFLGIQVTFRTAVFGVLPGYRKCRLFVIKLSNTQVRNAAILEAVANRTIG